MLQSCQKYVQFTASCLNIHENMRFTDEGTALVAFLPSIKEGHNMGNDKNKLPFGSGRFFINAWKNYSRDSLYTWKGE